MKKFFVFFIVLISFLVVVPAVFAADNTVKMPPQMFPDLFAFSDSTPFWIKIGSTKYYLIRERADGKYTYKDCVGYDETKTRLFEPLYELDSDGDFSKITAEELAKAKIRFVALGMGGSLELYDRSEDYPLENIAYIDLTKLTSSSRSSYKPYGSFAMYIKTDRGSLKKYIGHVDYQHPRLLKRLF